MRSFILSLLIVVGFADVVRADDATDLDKARAAVAVEIAKLQVRSPIAPAVPNLPKGDPYGFARYSDFHSHVKKGDRGVLVVGIADKYVGTYTPHCRVLSGFGGLTDGEYDCYLKDGVPVLERKAVSGGAAAPRPFTTITPGTPALSVNGSSSAFPGSIPTVRITTLVPLVGRRGVTSCSAYG